jgi:hypothetical protein
MQTAPLPQSLSATQPEAQTGIPPPFRPRSQKPRTKPPQSESVLQDM